MRTAWQKILLRLAAVLRRAAGTLDDAVARPAPEISPDVRGGPPAHWVARVREAAPHLLEPRPANHPVDLLFGMRPAPTQRHPTESRAPASPTRADPAPRSAPLPPVELITNAPVVGVGNVAGVEPHYPPKENPPASPVHYIAPPASSRFRAVVRPAAATVPAAELPSTVPSERPDDRRGPTRRASLVRFNLAPTERVAPATTPSPVLRPPVAERLPELRPPEAISRERTIRAAQDGLAPARQHEGLRPRAAVPVREAFRRPPAETTVAAAARGVWPELLPATESDPSIAWQERQREREHVERIDREQRGDAWIA